jgi:O-antigen/teichoic acid export membrane protein
LRNRIKARLGDLWWYTFLLFCAQRVGDAINLFIGLWLVPHYVPQAELGAVLPLAQIGNVLGLPLMVLLWGMTRFLSLYAANQETGKLKALLRDASCLMLVLVLGTLAYANFVMPPVFERMRVANGHLGMLIVLSGAVAAAAPIASTALQGLKLFRTTIIVTLISAPLRLAVMAVCLPIRGLSGYFVGQTIPGLITMGFSFVGLRHILNRKVKAVPYWRADGKRILAYLIPCALLAFFSVMQSSVETFVIRHRLPDLESAAFYMISRFAETGAYMGIAVIFVAFPLIAEKHERGEATERIMWHSMAGTLLAGGLLAGGFLLFGRMLLGSVASWRLYAGFAPQMALLTLIHAVRVATSCFLSAEMACGRSRYLLHYGFLLSMESVLLYASTGFLFFVPYVPADWIRAVELFNPCRLTFVLQVMFAFSLLPFIAVITHALIRRRRAAAPRPALQPTT